MYVCMYIYIYTYVCVCIYIYIHRYEEYLETVDLPEDIVKETRQTNADMRLKQQQS